MRIKDINWDDIVQINGPAASGKTRHLKDIRQAALAKGLLVIGPVPANGLWTLDEPAHAHPNRAGTVLLIDEYVPEQMGTAQKDAFLLACAGGFKQIFIAKQTSKRNEWKGLK